MRTVALIVAIALGIAAAIGVRTYIQGIEAEHEREQDLVEVAVPRRNLAAGEEVTPGNITGRSIPAHTLTADQVTMQDIQRYFGRELVDDVGANVSLRHDHFVRPEPRLASARLPAQHRAVTVSVDATSGVAGLIRPGNRVDIFCTGMGEAGGRGAQETWRVLSDVTVLAVDSQMSDLDVTGFERQRRGYSNLTLAVTPDEAQLLIYLMNNARLTFALRPEREVGEREELPPVSAGNVREISEQANRRRQQLLEEAADND